MASQRQTPAQREKHRASVRFTLWMLERAAQAGHRPTDVDTWLVVHGSKGRRGWQAQCTCGWKDPQPKQGKKAALRNLILHLSIYAGLEQGDQLYDRMTGHKGSVSPDELAEKMDELLEAGVQG